MVFYWIFNQVGLKSIGIGILVIFALIGFCIGTFKVPEIPSIPFTKKVSGDNLDDIIKRAITFKMKRNRIYVYTKKEKDNEPNANS